MGVGVSDLEFVDMGYLFPKREKGVKNCEYFRPNEYMAPYLIWQYSPCLKNPFNYLLS